MNKIQSSKFKAQNKFQIPNPKSQITLNGRSQEIEAVVPLGELLKRFKLDAPYLAVAVNEKVIPRSEHSVTQVKNGDRIEVIHAVGGG